MDDSPLRTQTFCFVPSGSALRGQMLMYLCYMDPDMLWDGPVKGVAIRSTVKVTLAQWLEEVNVGRQSRGL